MSRRSPGADRPLGTTAPNGDWCFLADPALTYAEQPVFWRPDLYAQAVVLAPCDGAGGAAQTFRPERWPGRLEARDGPGGRHVLLRVGQTVCQLLVDPGLQPDAPMALLTPADDLASVRLDAGRTLLRILAGRAPAARRRGDTRKLARFRDALSAFDNWQAGRSYRDTALQLYGAGRVASEAWRTSTLRDSAIRLTRLGRTLVAGGYRRLLARAPG
jgi:hypothetical protein